jgi:hypothetical protein
MILLQRTRSAIDVFQVGAKIARRANAEIDAAFGLAGASDLILCRGFKRGDDVGHFGGRGRETRDRRSDRVFQDETGDPFQHVQCTCTICIHGFGLSVLWLLFVVCRFRFDALIVVLIWPVSRSELKQPLGCRRSFRTPHILPGGADISCPHPPTIFQKVFSRRALLERVGPKTRKP